MLDAGDDEAPRRVDGDAQVDVAEHDVGSVEHAGVHLRVLAQRLDGGRADEGQEGEGHARFLELVLVLVAQLVGLEVYLGHGHHVG